MVTDNEGGVDNFIKDLDQLDEMSPDNNNLNANDFNEDFNFNKSTLGIESKLTSIEDLRKVKESSKNNSVEDLNKFKDKDKDESGIIINWTEIHAKLPTDLNPEDKERRVAMFKQFDVNENGYLSYSEILNGVRDVINCETLYDAKPAIKRAF